MDRKFVSHCRDRRSLRGESIGVQGRGDRGGMLIIESSFVRNCVLRIRRGAWWSTHLRSLETVRKVRVQTRVEMDVTPPNTEPPILRSELSSGAPASTFVPPSKVICLVSWIRLSVRLTASACSAIVGWNLRYSREKVENRASQQARRYKLDHLPPRLLMTAGRILTRRRTY